MSGGRADGYTDAPEWFTASPQICERCGALVPWYSVDTHNTFHESLETPKVDPS